MHNIMVNKNTMIIFSLIIFSLLGYSYYQHQQIVELKAEVEYQKGLVETQKNLTDMAQERCVELAQKLDEAQTPVQVVYSAPQTDSFTQYQQDQAYTDMLDKINRNLDQQYYDSVFK